MSTVKEYLLDEEEFLNEMYNDHGPDGFAYREEPDPEHPDISFEELSALLEMEAFFEEHGRMPTYREMSRGY